MRTAPSALGADYKAGSTQAFGEVGYAFPTRMAVLEPFANVAYVKLNTDGFTERGGAAALTANGQSTDATFSSLGLKGATRLGVEGLKVSATLGRRHAFGDVTPLNSVAFKGIGDGFTVAGVPIARDAAVIDAGVDFQARDNLTLKVSHGGQFGSGATDNGVRAGLRLRF